MLVKDLQNEDPAASTNPDVLLSKSMVEHPIALAVRNQAHKYSWRFGLCKIHFVISSFPWWHCLLQNTNLNFKKSSNNPKSVFLQVPDFYE